MVPVLANATHEAALSTILVIPCTLYLYFLFVRHLVLHQWFPDVMMHWVVFASWGGIFVKVQLGH